MSLKQYNKLTLMSEFGLNENDIKYFKDTGMIKENTNFLSSNSFNILDESLEKEFLTRVDYKGELSVTSGVEDVEVNLSGAKYDYPEYHTVNTQDRKMQKLNASLTQDHYIKTYRRLALRENVSSALEEIVNEAVAGFDDGESVKLDFVNDSELITDNSKLKKEIETSWNTALRVLNFNKQKKNLFREWYVDGKLPIELIYNNAKMKDGVHSCVKVNPINLRELVIDGNKKGFAYFDDGMNLTNEYTSTELESMDHGYKEEQMVMVESGVWDEDRLYQTSYIRYALKSINDINSIENTIVKYRITRSAQKNIWNIDIGTMPISKSERYLSDVSQDISSSLKYNDSTGEMDLEASEGIQDDYIFASRSGKNKTTVDTMSGDVDFVSKLDDLEYNNNKFYRGMKIPVGRLDKESSLDYSGEDILREELKFTSHVSTCRTEFGNIFLEIIKRDMISRGVATLEEFNKFSHDILFKWYESNVIVENAKIANFVKKAEAVQEIIDSGIVGKFISNRFLWENIMNMTESDYDEQIKQIELEKKKGEHKNEEE